MQNKTIEQLCNEIYNQYKQAMELIKECKQQLEKKETEKNK